MCYQRLSKFSLLYSYYAFLDTEEYLADALFIRHEVRVHFLSEYEKQGSPYRMILCRIRRKDADRVTAALEELPRKMLLCGYTDYFERCKEIWSELDMTRKRRDPCAENGTAEQAQ